MNALKIDIKKTLPILISVLTLIISLVTSYFVARPLGSELYGKVQFYIGVAGTMSIIGGLGLSNYITKNVQFCSDKKGFFTKWVIIASLFNIILFPIYCVISFFILTTFDKNIILIICVGIMSLLMTVLEIIGAFLLGTFDAHKSFFFQSFLPKLSILCFSLILIFGYQIYDNFPDYYVYCSIGTYFVIDAVFLVLLIRRTQLRVTKTEIFSLLSFFAVSCTYGLVAQLSKVIGAAYYNDLSMVGIYSISVQVISVSNVFSGAITNISKPFFASLKDDIDGLLSYFIKVTRINAYIVIPFLIGFMLQSQSILLIFGESYASVPLIMVILCVGALVSDLTGPNGTLLVMAGHEKWEILNGFITISSFLLFAFALKGFGIFGLAWANALSSILANLAKFIEVWIIYKKCPYNWKLLVHYLILCAFSALCFYGLSFINNLYLKLGLDAVVGLSLIILFNIITPYKSDKYFFFKKNISQN